MSSKMYAYIRSQIPSDQIVPTSEGFFVEHTQNPIIEHDSLYKVIHHGAEYDDQEFSLHIEISGFPNGVFVNEIDFSLIEMAVPNKELKFLLRIEENKTVDLEVIGESHEEIIHEYTTGKYDQLISEKLNEQKNNLSHQLFYRDEAEHTA